MDFDEFYDCVSDYSELESPSFLQGMLVGLICVDNDIEIATWIKKIMLEAKITKVKESLLKALHNMYLETQKGMNGSGFELNLCLPEDDAPMSTRLHMVAQFAEGVLYGIGLAGGVTEMEHELSEDVRDVIHALGEVARVEITPEMDKKTSDEDESDLIEIVEFLKVGVLLLNEELSPTQAAPIIESIADADDTVH
jgi:uncharacterized protein YgfB (UPF0149 family)